MEILKKIDDLLIGYSTATTRGGENNVSFELYTEKKAASEGEGGGSGSEEPGKGEGGSGGGVTPDPSI